MSVNHTIIQGNFTAKPDLRYTSSGKAMLQTTVAVNRKYKTPQGENQEETTFVDVKAFDRRAETMAKYFDKGDQVIVEGRLVTDQWEDKQTGNKRYALRLVASGFHFVGGGQGKASQPAAQTANSRPAQVSNNQPTEDDVPF